MPDYHRPDSAGDFCHVKTLQLPQSGAFPPPFFFNFMHLYVHPVHLADTFPSPQPYLAGNT